MQDYLVHLDAELSQSFRAIKAAQSVNLDVKEKSVHKLSIRADLTTEYNVGLIVGASGSGKTTLARQIFNRSDFDFMIDPDESIIDQMPEQLTTEECASILSAAGLTSIPCWLKPFRTLSNGQKARAMVAIAVARGEETIVIDEWTSVVNREVAKIMSHSIQKFIRKTGRQIVLVSCHYDVIDWLNPDWVIDCNEQSYTNRRSMVGTHTRSDRLRCDIKEVPRGTWKMFSQFHYLNSQLPGGRIYCFGLFSGANQIGFGCYANYAAKFRNTLNSNRVVVHPDYVGLGLGIRFVTETARIMTDRGFRIRASLTSPAMVKARRNHPHWKLTEVKTEYKSRKTTISGKQKGKGGYERAAALKEWLRRNAANRNMVRMYSYDFVP